MAAQKLFRFPLSASRKALFSLLKMGTVHKFYFFLVCAMKDMLLRMLLFFVLMIHHIKKAGLQMHLSTIKAHKFKLCKRLYLIGGAFALVVLSGCAETGDFGRPKNSTWNNTILPTAGNLIARARNEAVSSFEFTDDEQELRNRAWRFIMPAHERSYFDKIVAQLAYNRILPPQYVETDPQTYRHALHRGAYRSQVPRYQRLMEDVQADSLLIRDFKRIAHRVQRGDDIRCEMIVKLSQLQPDDERNARDRIAENNALIAWVHYQIPERLKSYRFTLERLVIETPSREAIQVERTINAFAQELESAGLLSYAAILDDVCSPKNTYHNRTPMRKLTTKG